MQTPSKRKVEANLLTEPCRTVPATLPNGAPLGIEGTDALIAAVSRINSLPNRATSAFLIKDENGQPLMKGALRSRFDKVRTAVKVGFQFRDVRGKAATGTGNLAHSQTLLGHKNRDMTEHYVKSRIGERVNPLR